MRILIVDDEPGIRAICGRALRAEGHDVVACESGEDAASRLEERWDLIVTDLNMPGRIDGNDLVRRTRAAGGTPIAMMTANPSLASSISALKDGACDYLVKPFALNDLIELVRRSEGRTAASAAAADAIEPRRLRMATILFADVRGFTAFSERLPPDEAARRLDEVLACFIEAVQAEGGSINKLIGDGAMAVFGAPLPHAEPAAAAARAALRARAAVKHCDQELRFGFGINTGLVAAGCLGSHGSAEYAVIGATVNLAARLEQTAGPGQILIGGEAASQLDARFVLSHALHLSLDGFRAPVQARELLEYLT